MKPVIVHKDDVKTVQLVPDPGVWMKELISNKTPSDSCYMGYIWIDPHCSSPRKPLFVEHKVEELYYVISGRAEVVYEDGTRRLLTPGSSVLHPPGTKHRLDNGFDEMFVFLFFYPSSTAPEIQDEISRRRITGEK